MRDAKLREDRWFIRDSNEPADVLTFGLKPQGLEVRDASLS